MYVEDLKLGTNKDIGPKDIFEMASNKEASSEETIDPEPCQRSYRVDRAE